MTPQQDNDPGATDGAAPGNDAGLTASESLPDGSSSDGSPGGNDTASGGAPEEDILTDDDGTPVENPSG